MLFTMSRRWRHFLFLVVLLFFITSETNARGKQKRRRGASRRPLQGTSQVNIQFVKATTVEIGFDYVQGAKRFIAMAKEWIDGKREQTVPTYKKSLGDQARSAVLMNLIPGREYLIEVRALNDKGKLVGSPAQRVVRTSQRCYICNGKKDNDACIGARNQMECPHDKDACLNEIRYSEGVPKLMKRCAQWRPELGKQIQKGVDITKACTGRENVKDAACKCMCRSDLCNEAAMPCINECFDELPRPDHLTLKCDTTDLRIGTNCTWQCYSGKIRGVKTSTCRSDRTWSVVSPPDCIGGVPPPKTRALPCPELIPEEGHPLKIVCSNGSAHESTCTFTCDNILDKFNKSEYRLKGDKTRTCGLETRGKWSGEQPVCVEITCPKFPLTDGLEVECTNGERIGSYCSFSCSEGRKFVGKSRLECLSGGRWTSSAPRCTVPDCANPPNVFQHVLMECDEMSKENKRRECRFSCEEGYKRFGPRSSICTTGNKWSHLSPTCKRIVCRPDRIAPTFGFVRCSDRNFYGSTCNFSCKEGYMLIGKDTTKCMANEKWSYPTTPICKKITCPRINKMKDGLYVCTGGQDFGSTCRFSCKSGFGFAAETRTKIKCVARTGRIVKTTTKDIGQWDGPIPECITVGCPPILVPPKNARVKCSNGATPFAAGTVCSFNCARGYTIVGFSRTTCIARSDGSARGDWSNPPPSCDRIQCSTLPELTFGEVSCTDDYFAGSKCLLNCNYGYKLSGKDSLTCGVEGLWSGKMPKCRLITCDPKPLLKNGVFNCPPKIPMTVDVACEAECNDGFKLSQPGGAICGIKGTWTISEKLKCDNYDECLLKDETGKITNGGCQQKCIDTEGSFFCACNEGYKLSPDGKTCIKLFCPMLEKPPNGKIDCTKGYRVASVCDLLCAQGYEVVGWKAVSCLKGGFWDKDIGSCRRVTCPALTAPEDGFMDCSSGFKFESECLFGCKEGYEIRGEFKSECGAKKKWSNQVPTCEKKQCDISYLIVPNAEVTCSDDNKFESICNVKCEDGYRPDGAPMRSGVIMMTPQCMETGLWNTERPTCSKKRCKPFVDDIKRKRFNSTIECTDGDYFESTCKLTCDKGFAVDGNYRIDCVGDAEWSQIMGYCRKVYCPALITPKNAQVQCTDSNRYMSVCMHYCETGYELVGRAQTKCLWNRNWTNKPPKCERIECEPETAKLLKGTVSCTDGVFFGSKCEYKCDPGYEFAEKEPLVDKRIVWGAEIDEKANLQVIELVCEASKVWSGGSKPVCVRHECTPPLEVMQERETYGTITCTNGSKFESICELSCNAGFEITGGRASTQCGEKRNWLPMLGRCERVRCPMFDPLINGASQCSDSNRFQSRCLFGCFRGYELVGSPSSVCESNRKFSHPPPKCEKIECPVTHMNLLNGNVTCTDGLKFKSECVYVCNPGYQMVYKYDISKSEVDNVVLTCNADRKWDGKMPFCTPKKCSLHDGALAKAKMHGEVTCNNQAFFGSVCSVVCHIGYKRIGARQTQCNADEDWSPTIGYCVRRECPALLAPVNGEMECSNGNLYESICKFKCDYGYELIGFKESQCLAMEAFSTPAPTCNEILCPKDFLKITNGDVTCTNRNKLASRCEYKCGKGYQLMSSSVDAVECLETRTWDEKKPICEKKVCPQGADGLTKAAATGSMVCTDKNRYQSVCTLICESGFEITEGTGSTECGPDQEWLGNIGYCTRIVCKEFAPLDDGLISCTNGLRYESICSFTCDPGYTLTHTKTSVCQANRKFTTKAPECIKIKCSSFQLRIHNGKTDCTDSNKFGSVCTYRCNLGFERVFGSETAECLADGKWSATKTGCERVQCDKSDPMILKAKEHGKVRCTSSNFYESVCTLQCNGGYKLTRLSLGQTQCNQFRKWEDGLGHCERIECPLYSAPDNGEMTCTNGNRYQSECVFSCNEGFEMRGLSVTECLINKKWTNKAPTCVKIECSDINLFLPNGISTCTDLNKFGSVCSFECDAGYKMEELIPEATCLASRAWTSNKPTCIKKECDMTSAMIVKASQNGIITCTDGARYQTECLLKCNEGYELVGNSLIECLATTKWNKKIGYCQRIRCDPLKPPTQSKMVCTNGFRYESVCSFECNEGYARRGYSESECLSNGSFSREPPKCIRTKCPDDYLNLPHGVATCTEKNLYGSICTYECKKGYRMGANTPSVVTSECLSTQLWSVEIPICEKKICAIDDPDILRGIDNSKIDCTEGNRYGSVCTITCNKGYELKGSETTKCLESTSWSTAIGICHKITCDELETFIHSTMSCTDENNYQSTCTFACEQGYRFDSPELALQEEMNLTCTSKQFWTTPGVPVECTKESCSDQMLKLANGLVSCTDGSLYKSQCIFQCNEGYELVNPDDDFDVTTTILTCGLNKRWSREARPTCQKITCRPNWEALNLEQPHSVTKCSDGSLFNSKCTIECNHGYELVGSSTSTCQVDRTWGQGLGKCNKISCPAISSPEDGTMECSEGFLFKSACKVTCRPGFQIYNPENDYDPAVGLECKADGKWCGEVPTCVRVKCPIESLSLVGGRSVCSNENLFESECKFMCNEGYQMTQGQDDVTECTAHMTWSNLAPTCEKRRCPANDSSIKEARAKGDVICTDENRYDSQCELQCPSGYELSGEERISCLESGLWSNGIGLCNKIECKPISAPKNAVMKCRDGMRYESLCSFACTTGYMLTEASLKAGNGILCQADKTWEGEIIECEKITCPAKGYSSLAHGRVSCNDTNKFMSRCLFECNTGYELADKVDMESYHTVTAECTELGFWDVRTPPRCVPIQCSPSTVDLGLKYSNGKLRCTSGSNYKSECKLNCNKGYELQGGESITLCGGDKKWGPKLGTCEKISCLPLTQPQNGGMVCDDGFLFMSQCMFECSPGYKQIQNGRKTNGITTCKADGTWDSQTPFCEKVACPSHFLSLKYGRVLCSDRNLYESECQYECDTGYELKDPNMELITCLQNGTWSRPRPLCKVKTCKSEYTPNGRLNCSGSEYNAVCQLECNIGHTLVDGAKSSTCTDVTNGGMRAIWTPPLGDCEKVSCPAIPEIVNGYMRCSDSNKFRSICHLECQTGYKMKKQFFATRCQSDATWSREFGECERVTCDPSYLEVEYGRVSATDGNNEGSTLKFSCPTRGHKFTGSSEVKCLNGGWNKPKPKCESFICSPINLPNGYVECTGKRYNDYGSRCTYYCNKNFERRGISYTECVNGRWTNSQPLCKGHCDIKFDEFRFGGVDCTNSHYHGSKCRFWCNAQDDTTVDTRYSLFGDAQLTCKSNGQWDGTPPCCAQNCPPWGKMDLFFVFDSSSSVQYANWRRLLDFASDVLSNFHIGLDNVLAGALRYYRDIDTRSEIPIGKYQTMRELELAIKYLPYGGYGTRTGLALSHVINHSLKQPGNRPDVHDVIILFTDGHSTDNVTEVAEDLKATNATVHVMGVQGARELDFTQMTKIASRPLKDHISIIRGGSGRITKQLTERLGKKVCQNPCLLDKDYRESSSSYIERRNSDDTPLRKSDISYFG